MTLKSVDDHNRDRRGEREEQEARLRRTGVACPACGEVLLWGGSQFNLVDSFPPRTAGVARCSKCRVAVELEL